MTTLGIDWAKHLENVRSNQAQEAEAHRSNIAKEAENTRSNMASEAIQVRNQDFQKEIARMNNESKELISSLDRKSKETIADLDRLSKEDIEQLKYDLQVRLKQADVDTSMLNSALNSLDDGYFKQLLSAAIIYNQTDYSSKDLYNNPFYSQVVSGDIIDGVLSSVYKLVPSIGVKISSINTKNSTGSSGFNNPKIKRIK